MSESYRFAFSVISAVYNAAPYLREMVDSIIRQSIGFERVQLILVDDGSQDESGAICDEYAARYPDNIVAVHQENGGVASARNAGLRLAEGRYLNFCDSDDKLSANALQKVAEFFENHPGQTDVVTIPMRFFDEQRGEHWQNYKFSKGSRVIDLWKEHTATDMSVSSSFFRAETRGLMDFDGRLVDSEDGKVVLTVLFEKMTLGVVTGATYWYRRHNTQSISRTRGSSFKPGYYSDYLTHYTRWAIDASRARFGLVPAFVQHQLMCALQWRFISDDHSDEVLTEAERTVYQDQLRDVLQEIDDSVILEMRKLYAEHKAMVLRVKYGREPEWVHSGVNWIPHYGQTMLPALADRPLRLEFLRCHGGEVELEGSVTLFALPEGRSPAIFAEVNGERIPCQTFERIHLNQQTMGMQCLWGYGFRVSLPLMAGGQEVRFSLGLEGGHTMPLQSLRVGSFFPVSTTLRSASYTAQGHRFTLSNGAVRIDPAPGWARRFLSECRFLREVWKRNALGGRKAVFGRMAFHLLRPLMRRQIWLISDRVNKADDNGEALFRYLAEHPLKGVHPIFAVSKASPDWERMRKIGSVVNAMSFRHKLLHLLCSATISSSGDATTVNPFSGHHEALRDLLQHQRYVFLQHGVTKDDISAWLSKYNKNAAGFVVSAHAEYQSIVEGSYGYAPEQVWLTGMPRFDRLYHDERRAITLMPTWRRYLMDHIVSETGVWVPREDFQNSAYFCFYSSLLTSPRLAEALNRYGYRLQMMLHPNMQPLRTLFPEAAHVTYLPLQMPYRDVFAQSNLVLTDYSSTVFDFAYLRKPVIYCQFDREEFFAGEHAYTKGYFDYERDGFGEVETDLEATVDRIIEYMKNGCTLKEKYRARIDRFFAWQDQNCCQRVVEHIRALDDK